MGRDRGLICRDHSGRWATETFRGPGSEEHIYRRLGANFDFEPQSLRTGTARSRVPRSADESVASRGGTCREQRGARRLLPDRAELSECRSRATSNARVGLHVLRECTRNPYVTARRSNHRQRCWPESAAFFRPRRRCTSGVTRYLVLHTACLKVKRAAGTEPEKLPAPGVALTLGSRWRGQNLVGAWVTTCPVCGR